MQVSTSPARNAAAVATSLTESDLSRDYAHSWQDARGETRSIDIVRTAERFREVCRWKRAFTIFEHDATKERLIVLAPWQDRVRGSSHSEIAEGMVNLLGARTGTTDQVRGWKRLSIGYVAADGNGRYCIEDLAGAMMYHEHRLGQKQLTKEAELVKHIFFDQLRISVKFAKPEEYWSQTDSVSWL